MPDEYKEGAFVRQAFLPFPFPSHFIPSQNNQSHRVQSGGIECLVEMGVHVQNSQVQF